MELDLSSQLLGDSPMNGFHVERDVDSDSDKNSVSLTSSLRLVLSRGGGPLHLPPPFEPEKNYEKSKTNRKWKERGQFDTVCYYFR